MGRGAMPLIIKAYNFLLYHTLELTYNELVDSYLESWVLASITVQPCCSPAIQADPKTSSPTLSPIDQDGFGGCVNLKAGLGLNGGKSSGTVRADMV
jgi:hypothetical protein